MKKYLFIVLMLALVLMPVLSQATTNGGTSTLAELQALVAKLQAQIKTLQQQQSQQKVAICAFSNDLSLGDGEGDGLTTQISALHKILISGGHLNIPKPTGWYGKLTLTAVKNWQIRNGLPATGVIGPKDRAVLCGGLVSTPAPVALKSSVLSPDQIKVTSPGNTTVSTGTTVKVTYIVGSNIVPSNPVIVERSVVDVNTDTLISSYTPVTQSSGVYSFDWTPSQPGTYQAILKVSLNNTQYTSRSGVITVAGTPVNYSGLIAPVISYFNISPDSLSVGQQATLSWNVLNVSRCVLQHGPGEDNISPSGTLTVYPKFSTYRLWCVNDPGTGKDGPSIERTLNFSIAPSITVVSPNGGETFTVGDTINIVWNAKNFSSSLNVNLNLIDKGGNIVRTIASNISNTGNYSWVIPKDLVSYGTTAAFKILADSNDKGPSAQDVSDSLFTILPTAQRTLSITDPLDNYGLTRNYYYPIKWSTTGLYSDSLVYIEVVGTSGTYRIAQNISNNGLFNFKVYSDIYGTFIPDGRYSVKVCAQSSSGNACDMKDNILISNKG